MKKYVIDSIKFDNCLKWNKDDLKLLECCKNCGNLPLPSLRSKKDPEKCLMQWMLYIPKNEIRGSYDVSC